jgi:hypothetical protein
MTEEKQLWFAIITDPREIGTVTFAKYIRDGDEFHIIYLKTSAYAAPELTEMPCDGEAQFNAYKALSERHHWMVGLDEFSREVNSYWQEFLEAFHAQERLVQLF